MKRLTLVSALALVAIMFTLIAGAQSAAPADDIVIPPATAEQLWQVEQKLAQLERDRQVQVLVRENLVLTAALEAGLTRKQLEEREIWRAPNGQMSFRKIQRPASSPSP